MDQPGLSELGQPAVMIDLDIFNEVELNMQRWNLFFS
jgi:hypothetical protein